MLNNWELRRHLSVANTHTGAQNASCFLYKYWLCVVVCHMIINFLVQSLLQFTSKFQSSHSSSNYHFTGNWLDGDRLSFKMNKNANRWRIPTVSTGWPIIKVRFCVKRNKVERKTTLIIQWKTLKRRLYAWDSDNLSNVTRQRTYSYTVYTVCQCVCNRFYNNNKLK